MFQSSSMVSIILYLRTISDIQNAKSTTLDGNFFKVLCNLNIPMYNFTKLPFSLGQIYEHPQREQSEKDPNLCASYPCAFAEEKSTTTHEKPETTISSPSHILNSPSYSPVVWLPVWLLKVGQKKAKFRARTGIHLVIHRCMHQMFRVYNQVTQISGDDSLKDQERT